MQGAIDKVLDDLKRLAYNIYAAYLLFPATLDLVDLEGHIYHLPNHPYDYAQNVLDGRKTYVLLKIESKYNM